MLEPLNIYVCPETKARLKCHATRSEATNVISGYLINEETGQQYTIEDGIPDLIFPRELNSEQREAMDYYEGVAAVYDDVAHLSFRIQYVDELKARRDFVRLLNVEPSARVLELACGTGRDSEFIAAELNETGRFYLQDISRSMLLKCREKLARFTVPAEFSSGNACYLPFPDRYFDAVFSFGGLGVFGDIRKSLREIVRVARVGAKVIVGDESMPPWLYETQYGRILLNNNPLFKNPIPLEQMPVEARDVIVRWVVGGVYYLIEFTVGEGEPQADFDLAIPGRRGGTLRTRYFGKLEGITPETYRLAHQAQERSGRSMHEWLDEVVRKAAEKELKN
ncbi:MAG TPA: methyltransferase domain-containing protein [Pyrinomonadaceae bacterium]|nr:methyltransferase domain-containing protein [Pyrinomonadaceae bacterium]